MELLLMLYLVPIFFSLYILWRKIDERNDRECYILDYQCYKPTDDRMLDTEFCGEIIKRTKNLGLLEYQFLLKAIVSSGIGEQTYGPRIVFSGREDNPTLDDGISEMEEFFCDSIGKLLERALADRAMFKLKCLVRTHHGARDESYDCCIQREDTQGCLGFHLGKTLPKAATRACIDNLKEISPKILPIRELVRFATSHQNPLTPSVPRSCGMPRTDKQLAMVVADYATANPHGGVLGDAVDVVLAAVRSLNLFTETIEELLR
ncbi:hypothetical protein NL676_031603 [Syzygium grande]|nr:hypothetical protein NL676_031603 [Syzygium grande]